MENKNGFTHSYSAKETEELKKIRSKYEKKDSELTLLEQVQELDKKAERPGIIISLILGILGLLILGVGMCCIMVWSNKLFALGVIVGIIGIAVSGIAYPVYKSITKRKKEQITPVILKLTDNISNM